MTTKTYTSKKFQDKHIELHASRLQVIQTYTHTKIYNAQGLMSFPVRIKTDTRSSTFIYNFPLLTKTLKTDKIIPILHGINAATY